MRRREAQEFSRRRIAQLEDSNAQLQGIIQAREAQSLAGIHVAVPVAPAAEQVPLPPSPPLMVMDMGEVQDDTLLLD